MFKGAEVLVQEEDTQNIEEPLVKPLRKQTFSVLEKETPETIVCFPSSGTIRASFATWLWSATFTMVNIHHATDG